jgi:hypothetical protein
MPTWRYLLDLQLVHLNAQLLNFFPRLPCLLPGLPHLDLHPAEGDTACVGQDQQSGNDSRADPAAGVCRDARDPLADEHTNSPRPPEQR